MPFTQGVSRRGFALVTLDNFRTVLHSTFYLDLVWQTLLMSAGAATCVMALTVVAGWLAVRRRPGAWLLDQLATAPLIFPGIVLGVAMIQIYLSVPVAIYGTLWAFIIAFTIRFLPYGMRYSASGMLQIHPELEEAAAIAGSSLRTAAAHRRAAGDAGAAGRLAVHLPCRRARSVARRDSCLAVGAAGVGGDVRPVGQRPGHRTRGVRPGLDGDHGGDRRRLLSHWAADHRVRRHARKWRMLRGSRSLEEKSASVDRAAQRRGGRRQRPARKLGVRASCAISSATSFRGRSIWSIRAAPKSGGERCYPDFGVAARAARPSCRAGAGAGRAGDAAQRRGGGRAQRHGLLVGFRRGFQRRRRAARPRA